MASIEKHGDNWRGVYDLPTKRGRSRRKTPVYPSKKRALQAAQDAESAIRRGTWFDDRKGDITVRDYFLNQWVPNRVAEDNTRRNWMTQFRAKKHGIEVTWGDVQLRRILASDVQGWVTRMIADGMSPATIEARFKVFQTMLAAKRGASATRDGLIQTNPCLGVEIPKRRRKPVQFYEADEVEAILDAMESWWVPLAMIAAGTGMRWGEVIGLQPRDFSLDYRSVTVNRVVVELPISQTGNGTRFKVKEHPKEGPDRDPKVVALDAQEQDLLRWLIASRDLGREDFLFSMPDKAVRGPSNSGESQDVRASTEWAVLRTDVWSTGVPVSRNYFRQSVWRKAIEKAGLPYLRFHALRASHITWLLHAGVDMPTVMDRVGHTQYTTTRRYMGVMAGADDRALEGLRAIRGPRKRRFGP